jgi:hypothetical protein
MGELSEYEHRGRREKKMRHHKQRSRKGRTGDTSVGYWGSNSLKEGVM